MTNNAQIIDRLKKLKLTGPGIWIAYKDGCKQDLGVFASKVLDDSAAQLVNGYYDFAL